MTTQPILGDWEIPRIQKLRSDQRRNIAKLSVPGRAGGLLQDLDSAPATIEIHGSVAADERTGFLENVREKFGAGSPLTFVADITLATDIQYVVVDSLVVEESSHFPDQVDYHIQLIESPPPPPPTDFLSGIDSDLLDQAGDFIDGVTDVLDAIDVLGDIPDFTDPTSLLGGALDDVTDVVGGLDSINGQLNDLFGED